MGHQDSVDLYKGVEHLYSDTEHLHGGKLIKSGGILINAPGAQFELLENGNSADAISAVVVSLGEKESTWRCIITPAIRESAIFPPWKPKARYGVLCDAPIDPSREVKAAILLMMDCSGTHVVEEEEGGWARTTHICRIRMEFLNQAETPGGKPEAEAQDSSYGRTLSAKFLEGTVMKRNWCVM